MVESLGVETVPTARELGSVNILIAAVKPHDLASVLAEAQGCLSPETLVISVAAGVTLDKLAELLPAGQPLIRAMPNTPALVGKGVTALSPAGSASQEHLAMATRIFSAVGQVVGVREDLMDAVTGLSGSGPAYVFLIVDALADAGVRQGLTRSIALSLAVHTVAGSAELLLKTGQHPAQLKEMVTSPGGTTIAGLEVLESAGLRGTLMQAVGAAVARSKELGKP